MSVDEPAASHVPLCHSLAAKEVVAFLDAVDVVDDAQVLLAFSRQVQVFDAHRLWVQVARGDGRRLDGIEAGVEPTAVKPRK